MNLKGFVLASVLALAIGGLESAVRAQSSAGRWVGSWATAVVGRPQLPPPPGPPAPAPFMRNACPAPATPPPVAPAPGQTFGPQPFMHFTNQTLRQIVHVSVGGSRAARRAQQPFRHRAAHHRRRPHCIAREGCGPSSLPAAVR